MLELHDVFALKVRLLKPNYIIRPAACMACDWPSLTKADTNCSVAMRRKRINIVF